MPYRRRRDAPGEWFHVMNRAVARRTLFELGDDIRQFLDRIAEAVARGWIEVHAYSVLTTHFHALVRSPGGEMSRALHHAQLGYVRHFNRTRRRDGPLLRGRFRSKLVDSLAYRRILVGYIDMNAPRAGLAARPEDYAFGSCRYHVDSSGPEWLSRSWVEGEIAAAFGENGSVPSCYARLFHEPFTDAHHDLVERRAARRTDRGAPADDLLEGVSDDVRDWMMAKARLADGTHPGEPLVPPATLALLRRETPDIADECAALLYRQLAGLTFAEIGRCMHRSGEGARRLVERAFRALREDADFRDAAGRHGKAALMRTYGAFGRPHRTGRTKIRDDVVVV